MFFHGFHVSFQDIYGLPLVPEKSARSPDFELQYDCQWPKKTTKKNGGLNPQKTTKNGGLNPKKTTLFNKITFQIPPKKKDSQKRC